MTQITQALEAAARRVLDEFGTSSEGLQQLYQALSAAAPSAAEPAQTLLTDERLDNMMPAEDGTRMMHGAWQAVYTRSSVRKAMRSISATQLPSAAALEVAHQLAYAIQQNYLHELSAESLEQIRAVVELALSEISRPQKES